MQKQKALEAVLNGVWGTIGPYSLSSAKAIAELFGCAYGLTTFSASAALETALRSLEISFGDEVIVASYSDPMDMMVTAAIGATPVFADIAPASGTLSPESAARAMTANTRAVIADAPAGNPCDARALSALCDEKGVKLILNLADGYRSAQDSRPLAQYAYASVISLADGCALSAGEGGALVCNDRKAYVAAFAYHNCGRSPGEGSTLEMGDDILGGDLRIAEWQAALAEAGIPELAKTLDERKTKYEELLPALNKPFLTPLPLLADGVSSRSAAIFVYRAAENENRSLDQAIADLCAAGYQAGRGFRAMHRQPVLQSDYFKKITGFSGEYKDESFPHSLRAEETYIWIAL